MKWFISSILVLLIFQVYSGELSENGYFSGRISRINRDASLLRIKVNFDNLKYLNAKDQVQFWDEKNDSIKCKSYVVARSAEYLLIRVPEIKDCQKSLYITEGSYFKFYSEDLKNNIMMGKEVVSILIKKRMAVQGQLDLKNKDLVLHNDRLNTVNARYATLRKKLEEEWQKEIHNLEEDRTYTMRSREDLERRRDEIDQKLELYKVKDENLTLDRWSLDTNLYYKK